MTRLSSRVERMFAPLVTRDRHLGCGRDEIICMHAKQPTRLDLLMHFRMAVITMLCPGHWAESSTPRRPRHSESLRRIPQGLLTSIEQEGPRVRNQKPALKKAWTRKDPLHDAAYGRRLACGDLFNSGRALNYHKRRGGAIEAD